MKCLSVCVMELCGNLKEHSRDEEVALFLVVFVLKFSVRARLFLPYQINTDLSVFLWNGFFLFADELHFALQLAAPPLSCLRIRPKGSLNRPKTHWLRGKEVSWVWAYEVKTSQWCRSRFVVQLTPRSISHRRTSKPPSQLESRVHHESPLSYDPVFISDDFWLETYRNLS